MKILIHDLKVETIIGILDHERENKQKISLNIEIEYNYDKNYFIDYAKVVQKVTNLLHDKQFFLLEDAVNEIYEMIVSEFRNINSVLIEIKKCDILPNCKVGLSFFKKID